MFKAFSNTIAFFSLFADSGVSKRYSPMPAHRASPISPLGSPNFWNPHVRILSIVEGVKRNNLRSDYWYTSRTAYRKQTVSGARNASYDST